MVEIKVNTHKPKYLQLAENIIHQIENNKLFLNQRLPSVNQMSQEMNISRETVFKALNYLSERGVVYSKNRKGYFVNSTDVKSDYRVFLMLDKFTTFKDDLYHSLYDMIGKRGRVDVYFHHHNYELFKTLINNNLNNYTHFAVVTFLKEDVRSVLNLIPPEKRIILDCKESDLDGKYSMIYQDFSKAIYNALYSARNLLLKYNKLILVGSNSLYHLGKITPGFNQFCEDYHFLHEVLQNITTSNFKKEAVYITLGADEIDITNIIKFSHERGYKIGKDIGIISYNDTPIKEVLEGGITVISTDFRYMGKTAAELIINKETNVQIENPTKLIIRNSL